MKPLHKKYLEQEPLRVSNLLETANYRNKLTEGLLAYLINDYENAIITFDEILKLNPEDYDAWFFKSMAMDKIGNIPEAKYCLEKAEKIIKSLDSELDFGYLEN